MAKAKSPSTKVAAQAAAGKETAAVKADDTKHETTRKKPDAAKVKTPVKKAVDKAPPEKATKPVTPQPAKGDTAQKTTVADAAKKAKGAFAKKMDEVKDTAAVIGHKIADVAKEANEKSEGFEDAIASGLHEMKKDIHKFAVNIAKKTEE